MTGVRSEPQIKTALRQWVQTRNADRDPAEIDELDDQTPLIATRYLTSPEVPDLLLFIEELRQSPVDPASLRAGVFQSIDAIYDAFFNEG